MACPLQLLKTVKRCRKEILESILHNYSLPLRGCLHSRPEPSTSHQHLKMPRKGTNYQYVPMINTLPHPNKALVFPCPLRQSVRQWQLRPLSYNVHQLLCRVWNGCVMSPWPSVENCLPKLGLTMIPQPELQPVRDDSLAEAKPSKLLQLAELEICEFHSGFCTIEEV